MYDLSEMFSNIGYYNRMFKAKTYLDAAYEFYDKYKDIFNEINEHAAIAAESVEEIYIGEIEEEEIKEVKKAVFYKRTTEEIKRPNRRKLSDEMQKSIDVVADEFLEEAKRCVCKKSRLPKGRDAIDLSIFVVMYVFPGMIETNGQFSYEIAETIGKKWPDVFHGNKLGCADYKTIDSGFKRKLCYITTAVCDNLSKPDDCSELTTLRRFRDDYMMSTDNGRKMVEEYYDRAPAIVMAIDLTGNADEIYPKVYRSYILPCIDLIKNGKNEECMLHYKEMVDALS